MQVIITVLFYIWLAAAIVYWARRFYLRSKRDGEDEVTTDDKGSKRSKAAKGADDDADKEKPAFSRHKAKSDTTGTSVRDLVDADPAPKRADLPDAAPGGLVEAVIREELQSRGEASPAEGDAGDAWARPSSASSSSGDRSTATTDDAGPANTGRAGFFATKDAPARPRRPISALLEGIALPCDLTPFIDDPSSIDEHHVTFLTTGVPPAEVGAAVADELERLGFELRSINDTELAAQKDGDEMRIILHPDAATERKDEERVFPSAPGGSVAVEFLS